MLTESFYLLGNRGITRAIKKLNNNVAYCVDASGKDVIALGRGLGFGSFPRELSLNEIERTFITSIIV